MVDSGAATGDSELAEATKPAKDPPSIKKPTKDPTLSTSALGVALGATGRPGTAGQQINHDMTDRIARKYFHEVRGCEQERALTHMPLEQLQLVRPDSQDMARTIKDELDKTLTKACPPGIDLTGHLKPSDECWDGLFGTDEFKRRMNYLQSYARTGHFIEQYGTMGRYEGEFLYGMRHGRGVHEFRDEVYDGMWKWDHRHGYGELTLKDGSMVKGHWQSGKPHGSVTMTDAKGVVVYEGEFKEGKRHGLGRQIFESGDWYDGGWEAGRLHDRGVYYFTNGDKFYGMWKQGLYDGVGVFHYADGSISRRVYKDGVLQSVQDYEHSSQKFGKTINRVVIHKHTRDAEFPKDVFLLSTV